MLTPAADSPMVPLGNRYSCPKPENDQYDHIDVDEKVAYESVNSSQRQVGRADKKRVCNQTRVSTEFELNEAQKCPSLSNQNCPQTELTKVQTSEEIHNRPNKRCHSSEKQTRASRA